MKYTYFINGNGVYTARIMSRQDTDRYCAILTGFVRYFDAVQAAEDWINNHEVYFVFGVGHTLEP